jgi:outer membrane murein-binding lipoprotein Lpp
VSERESNASVLEEVRRLDQAVADLRAQAGVEASELRARVRELERQVEQLTAAPPAAADSEARASKAPKAERAAARAAKAERAAAKKQARATKDTEKPSEKNAEDDDEENELD